MTTPLPLPDDPRVAMLIEGWASGDYNGVTWPRSAWLKNMETLLRMHYPQASSDELTLTARLAAPFPLAKPGVP